MVEVDEEGNLEGGPVLELVEFAERYLRDRPVAVVCDSDWDANDLVREQTTRVANLLGPYVGEVFACAPPEGEPYGWRHPVTKVAQRKKRGADDWLGEHARDDRHDAFLEIGRFEIAQPATLMANDPRLLVAPGNHRRPRADGRQTTVDVVRMMGELASPDGIAPFALHTLAERLDRPASRVQAAYARAIAAGLLEPLTEAVRASNGRSVWTEPALVRVAPEALPGRRWRSLREWLT
jgi:hypothetical protein